MRICPKCRNNSIREQARFCDLCGTMLPSVSSPHASPVPQSRLSSGKYQSAVLGRPVAVASRAGGVRSRAPSGPRVSWAQVGTLSTMPQELNIEGTRWLQVDVLELRNRESEQAHSWEIEETRQVYQERGTKPYPDGQESSCRGYLVKGGFSRYTILNLVPNAPLVLVRQVWAEGVECGELYVGEYTAGAFEFQDLDIQTPMRNRVHQIPRSLIQDRTLTLEQEDLGSDNGLYYFTIWAYQPGDAVDAQSSAEARAAATGNVGGSEGAKVAPSGIALRWDALKQMGTGLPESFKVLNKEWHLIDHMNFVEKTSPDNHSFAVYDAENYFTYPLKSCYPGGEQVDDSGIRWDKGSAEWTIGGTELNRDIALVIRVDVREGIKSFDVFCEDRHAGNVPVEPRDPVNRWRNVVHVVPARSVSEGTAHVRLELPEGHPGMNMFRCWFYQAR